MFPNRIRENPNELRAIELEENTERLDLDSYEASKQRLAMIRAEQAAAEVEPVKCPDSGQIKAPGKRRRKRKAGSVRDVEERTGVSRSEQRRTEEHVALAERYPVFQRPQWKKHNVIEAGVSLEQLAVRIRARAIRRCGELLKQIERPEQGGRPHKNGGGGDPVSRTAAASDAGLSERQRKQALRVANVPRGEGSIVLAHDGVRPFHDAAPAADPGPRDAAHPQGDEPGRARAAELTRFGRRGHRIGQVTLDHVRIVWGPPVELVVVDHADRHFPFRWARAAAGDGSKSSTITASGGRPRHRHSRAN